MSRRYFFAKICVCVTRQAQGSHIGYYHRTTGPQAGLFRGVLGVLYDHIHVVYDHITMIYGHIPCLLLYDIPGAQCGSLLKRTRSAAGGPFMYMWYMLYVCYRRWYMVIYRACCIYDDIHTWSPMRVSFKAYSECWYTAYDHIHVIYHYDTRSYTVLVVIYDIYTNLDRCPVCIETWRMQRCRSGRPNRLGCTRKWLHRR